MLAHLNPIQVLAATGLLFILVYEVYRQRLINKGKL
jgi:hypothetical protein